ncbi:MAG: O-antigen ligase family protein [Endomicrobiia bacterium]
MVKTQEIFIIFFSILIIFLLTKLLISNPNILFLGLILATLILFISFFSPQVGLVFLIFSMLLSPEIKLADVPGREVVVRIDDLLIAAVFLGWFAKSIFTKKLEIVVTGPLLPIFLYTIVCIISTYLGVISGRIVLTKAFFYLLKYLEYFTIYFLTTQIVKTKKQLEIYLLLFIITSIIVNIHGYTLIGKVERLYAPFDKPSAVIGGGEVGSGEANTYGGYLLIVISLLISLFCYSDNVNLSSMYIFLTIFSLIPFAYTKSRSSYLGFVFMTITLIVLTEKKKILILTSLLLLFVLSPIIFPQATQTVVERIKETFAEKTTSQEEATVLGFKIRELSALARIQSWKKMFNEFIPKRPVLGFGVTGVGLVDTQIPLIVGETGLLGLTIFLWLVISVFDSTYKVFKTSNDLLYKSISLCVFSSLVGLLFQSTAANTFIIIRIMEPFWFLTGIATVLPQIEKYG